MKALARTILAPSILGLACLGLAACPKETPIDKPVEPASTASPVAPASTDEEPPPPPPGGRPLTAYRDGVATEMTDVQAVDAKLVPVDLSNYWVPFIFSEQDNPESPRLVNGFRSIFRKLANDWPYESRTMAAARKLVETRAERARQERIAALKAEGLSDEQIQEQLGLVSDSNTASDTGPEEDTAEAPKQRQVEDGDDLPEGGPGDEDNYLEVYGIPPTLSVLKKRMAELSRDCFAKIDYERIAKFDGFLSYIGNDTATAMAKKGRFHARKVRDGLKKHQQTDPMALVNIKGSRVTPADIKVATQFEAIAEVQKQLECEGLYSPSTKPYIEGGLDWKTHKALLKLEHKNRIFGWGYFGKETLEALKKTPKERLFDSFLRVLAERVIDARGVIEDGTAVDAKGEPATYKDQSGQQQPVPNLVAESMASAMRHMGLGTPDKVVEFLESHDDVFFDRFWVAVPMPELPPYYSPDMKLSSVIDRGDIWYDYPYTADGKQKGQPRSNMPTNTLYVEWNGQRIPLLRTNTTIGGWRSEFASDGYEYFKYKNSDVGQRVWKDVVAGPVWLPPATTPPKELLKTVRYKGREVKVPNYDEFGPWYASAYGLVAGFHVRPSARKDGSVDYYDNGIRSHGSVDYNSILRRFSHGCHRLYNHMAIRLFNFVLRHKPFVRVGEIPAGFGHDFEVDAEKYTIAIESKGYKYELKDPLPVEVLTGRIRGKQRVPIDTYMPKPEEEYGTDAQFLPEWYVPPSKDTDTSTAPETDTTTNANR
ncbi:MAG: hypothetical protein MUC50_09230 [Myxococcota bacterium]|jgi:hypothetical protein|nr:hypothetical protein [Myxococcota bacterium]